MVQVQVAEGGVYQSGGVQMYTEYKVDYRGDPTVEYWAFAHSEDDPNHGYGYLRVSVLEIVQSRHSGTLAVYRKQWFSPENEPLNGGRRVVGSLSSLKALLSRRKMVPVDA